MQTKFFSPSINIIRDQGKSLNYIPTRNGENAFNKIVNAYQHGTRAFNIVGAYGSGKSSFILAFEKVLNKKAQYFENISGNNRTRFESHFIVGEYGSFKQSFCQKFNIDEKKDIFSQLKENNSTGLLIVVDEFGKFLEFAAKESPEEEMYFIQQLAEHVNSLEQNIFFITTLHQSFEDYALNLPKAQRNEWDKVKGRLIEVSFNEPVEQLLVLASERLQEKQITNQISEKQSQRLYKAISEADTFPLRDYFTYKFAQKLFPFDILSASIITLAFQSYGQNERSLFTFLDSDDYLGLNDFSEGDQFYGLANIYDYLVYNFYSLLNSKFNPHGSQWSSIKEALERAESSSLDENVEDALKLIKSIGLLSIFGRAGQKITPQFIHDYGQIVLGIKEPEKIIDKLEQDQIIRYQSFNQRYVLFKGTDFDINKELILAENRVSKDIAIVPNLYRYFSFPIIQAKKVFYEIGTPRYFTFELTEKPIDKEPDGANDGFINLIFNELLDEQKLKTFSRDSENPILFGWVTNTTDLKEKLIEIEKINLVKALCPNDIIALAELDQYLKNCQDELKELFSNTLYGTNSNIKWFYNGEEIQFKDSKALNKKLSEICEEVYSKTPMFRNEMMNREKVSGTISTAKKRLITQILQSVEKPDLGFEDGKFPPERTIYLSLINDTGIHQENEGKWRLDKPSEKTFEPLWIACEDFLNGCATAQRKLNDLIEILKQKPFKLKQGFIDFWIPIFLLTKQKHFALYEEDVFIPHLTDDTLEVAMKQPQKYFVSTFLLDETRLNIFNRYRQFLNQVEEELPTGDSFIETVKPFLVFFKQLVPYTKNTKNLSQEAIRLRDAIANATNPEKVFFEDIPRALNYKVSDLSNDQKLSEFTVSLLGVTQELSGAYESLINRIEDILNSTLRDEKLSFPNNKTLLQKRFKKIQKAVLNPKQKVLLQRINTPLDDRKSWINSIAIAVVNKSLDQFSDEEEKVFKIRFVQLIHELDNLTDISKKDIDVEKEEVLKLEITSFVKGVQKNLIRLPKNKSKEIANLEGKIKSILNSDNRQINIALLIKLLQEQIEDE